MKAYIDICYTCMGVKPGPSRKKRKIIWIVSRFGYEEVQRQQNGKNKKCRCTEENRRAKDPHEDA